MWWHRIRLLVLLLPLGCSEPRTLANCEDADCQFTLAEELWNRDRDALATQIQEIEDDVERAAVVLRLAERYPGQTDRLCHHLARGPDLDRCVALNRRSHLRPPKQDAPKRPPDVSKGDPVGQLALPVRRKRIPDVPWTEDREPVDCQDAVRRTCIQEAATAAALEGDYAGAAAACRQLGEKWSAECFFAASEEAVKERGTEGMEAALALCYGAERFCNQCLIHWVGHVARLAPPAGSTEPDAWSAVKRGIQTARTALGTWDEALAQRVVARLHAEALAAAYRRTERVTGAPLDALSESAHPHVRAAAAWRLWELEGSEAPRSFDAWGDRLDAALESREPAGDRGFQRRESIPRIPFRRLSSEEDVPLVVYLGQTRRFRADDPAADARVCLLEAAARSDSPPLDVFAQALDHPHRAVQLTAARMLQHLDTEGRHLDRMANHEDPAIRTRADRATPAG